MVLGYFLITNYNYVFGTYIYIIYTYINNKSMKIFFDVLNRKKKQSDLTLELQFLIKVSLFYMKFEKKNTVELILLCYRNVLNVFPNWFFEFFDIHFFSA